MRSLEFGNNLLLNSLLIFVDMDDANIYGDIFGMDWKTQLIIARPQANGTLIVVNECASLKDARYWLNYIAEPYDALFLTPLNPKYAGDGSPAYSCHLISRAKTEYDKKKWMEKAFELGEKACVTFKQNDPIPQKKEETQTQEMTETEIITLADGHPRSLTIDQLKKIISNKKTKVKVILSEPTKWIDWESALTLMTKDVFVIDISSDPKWPLAVTLDPKSSKGENMNFSEEMKFIVKRF